MNLKIDEYMYATSASFHDENGIFFIFAQSVLLKNTINLSYHSFSVHANYDEKLTFIRE